jgi:hypothetical protein
LTYPQKQKSTHPSRPLPKRQIFPFLRLPAEIRNIIYEECLSDPRGVSLCTATKHYRRTVERYISPKDWDREYSPKSDNGDGVAVQNEPTLRPLVPSLLAVNKQIYQEARNILYENEFKLADPLALHSFIVDIGSQAAKLLTHVTLCSRIYGRSMQKGYNHSAFSMLASATNIKKLRIESLTNWRDAPSWAARQFYRDGFPWLEAVGAAKGKLDAALDLLELCSPDDNCRNADYEEVEPFKRELVKLLRAHMERMNEKPAPTKKTKMAKKDQFVYED